MDLGITRLLLLLLLLSSACCRTTTRRQAHRRSGDSALLQRSVRAVSPFLEPPPLPASYRRTRAFSAPTNRRQQSRNARYTSPQSTSDSGYLGKLVGWLNPWANDGQTSSRVPQYAPRMPYAPPAASGPGYYPPKFSDHNCNPCDTYPWTPLIRQDLQSHASQYASSFAASHFDNLSSSKAPAADPHLSLSPTPPLYGARPFHDGPTIAHSAFQPQFEHPIAAFAGSQQQQQQPHYDIEVQQSPIIDVEEAAASVEYRQPANSGLDSLGFQQQQQQHVTKDAPFDLQVEISQHDADQAESRPVLSASSSAVAVLDSQQRLEAGSTNVHFQRSPLIELSVAGESPSTTTPRPSNWFLPTRATDTPKAKGASANLINYIVSSPREDSSIVRRPASTSPPPPPTQPPPYEFDNNASRTKLSDNDDSSASREVIVPSKTDNGKKVIQIIIPYTSQYTPSPFHPTKSLLSRQPDNHRSEETTPRVQLDDNSLEDSALVQESRRVSVTRAPESEPEPKPKLKPKPKPKSKPKPQNQPKPRLHLHNNQSNTNSIDVHRLQKNIDNWTIQEYAKKLGNFVNTTYPRWISSKQIPDEYLATAEEQDSGEYDDFSPEWSLRARGINRIQASTSTSPPMTTTTTTTTTPTTTSTAKPTTPTKATRRVNVVQAVYPKSTQTTEYVYEAKTTAVTVTSDKSAEKVYVVTPIPNANSLEVLSSADKDQEARLKARRAKVKEPGKVGGQVEQAYQVLPQAVNSLAVLANAPESAAPALWGIMEHEQFSSNANQPRWRSESDVLPEPASTPILYAGHSKVTYFRTKLH